jgi:hypothetical protein
MNFANLVLVQAVVWVVVGAAFLAIPRQWVAPFGTRMDVEAAFFGRLLGTSFLSFAILCWFGRDTGEATAQQAIAYTNLAANGMAAVLHAIAVIRGEVINARGWGLVVLTGALAVAWVVVALS